MRSRRSLRNFRSQVVGFIKGIIYISGGVDFTCGGGTVYLFNSWGYAAFTLTGQGIP